MDRMKRKTKSSQQKIARGLHTYIFFDVLMKSRKFFSARFPSCTLNAREILNYIQTTQKFIQKTLLNEPFALLSLPGVEITEKKTLR
jgi:hypothetical protein